jgi:hypothetical protein
MRNRAIAEYHDLLTADESLTSDLFGRLKEGMSAKGLLYGDRELGIALRPHFLNRAQYDDLAQAAEILAGAFDKLPTLLWDDSLMDRIGLRDAELRLARIDPGFGHAAVTTRLDAFVIEDGVKFVEYNAENPSSLTDQAGLNFVLFELRALQTTAKRYRLRQFSPVSALLRALLSTYREWGGKGTPNVAIVDWSGLPTASEFILLRNNFVACGVPSIICTPDELEYTGGRLRKGDFEIDLVYKRVIIHEFLDRYDETHPLVQAYANHDVCLINPFRCKLLHKKAAFEVLTDQRHEGLFTSRERDVIARCVPWTRRVTERKTVYRGQSIDLLDYIRKYRAGFILKPNDDYGGRGIQFGRYSSEAEWDCRLSAALKGDYIVQEVIDLPTEVFPIFDTRGWSFQPMFVDTNPFIFRGRVNGAMVRLSDSPIVNVTSGGGETGFLVIEGKGQAER